MNKIKNYFCCNCKQTSHTVGVTQKETHYYSIDLETNDWEDFHGSEDAQSQDFFCINCQSDLKYFELD